ncbi:hypothetical protein KKC60_03880, partial [Patescibacteria group bacterium]|nr:hypothetical protein [Patescibacteria group bacterium]
HDLNAMPEGQGVKELQLKLKDKRQEVISNLKNKEAQQDNPKAKQNLESSIKELENLNLDEISSPQDIYNTLSKHKDFNEVLRQTMFYFGFYLNPNIDSAKFNDINPEDPTPADVSQTLNFINHITNPEILDHIENQGSLKKFFTDERAAKNFKNLLNVNSLKEELQRMSKYKKDSTERMAMQFVPHRDLLTEFSGEIGDACWAGKEKSILEAHPNFTSLIMIQNPDSINERVAGSCFLIETTTPDGQDLLVIRGLNPLENVIRQLNYEDFYENLTTYLKTIAAKQNRQLAVVIDDHSGGSGSNREDFYLTFLSGLRDKLKAVELNNEDTEFNGYNITGDTYLV